MDRYNQLKVKLKNWETTFLQQHKRKPNKIDVDAAPEETQKLYKEYRALKQAREQESTPARSTAEPSPSCQAPVKEPPETETGLDSNIWGSHLNRGATTPKLTPKDRDSLKASAQYFGMKLKSNLGAAIKDRPSSLRKSFNPKWKPARSISEADPASITPARNPFNVISNSDTKSVTPTRNPLHGISDADTKSITPTRNPFNGISDAHSKSITPSRNPLHGISDADTKSITPTRNPLHGISDAHSKSITPSRIPVSGTTGGKQVNGFCDFSGRNLEATSSLVSRPQAEHVSHLDDDLPPLKLGFNPSKLDSGGTPNSLQLNKFQQLRRTVGQRMTSLDPSWLDRCQGIKGQAGGRPEVENTPAADTKSSELTEMSSPRHTLLSSPDTRPLQSPGPLTPPVLNSGRPPPITRTSLAPHGSLKQQDLSGVNEELPSASVGSKGTKKRDGCRPAAKDKESTMEGEMRSPAPRHSGALHHSSPARECVRPAEIRQHDDNLAPLGHPMSDSVHEEKRAVLENEAAPLPKKAKRSVRKRQREASAEKETAGDKASAKEGAAKKRRWTKASATPVEKNAPARRRKAKADRQAVEEEEEMPPTAEKSTRPAENLMGDLEEEVKSSCASRGKSARPSSNHNANYVRINLKNKSHVKGYALKGNHLRKQMWKQKYLKKGEQFGGGGRKHFDRGSDTCFRCGESGHWASDCQGKSAAPLLSQENAIEVEEEEISLPTLEEVARLTNTQLHSCAVPAVCERSQENPEETEEEPLPLDVVRPAYEPPVAPPPMEPLYPLGKDGKVIETPQEVLTALSEMGYRSFRPGQEIAIMRILSGLSTLVVLSTGLGKSLCYQLPAYLYAKRSNCITLVISPLVSLMDDQVSGLPPQLKAVCIHSNMTKSQREAALEKVKEGLVHVLLLSPEALVGGGYSGSSCLPPADQLPPVAFACIDEAHCVSEWSHNFRPCYLRLCKVLRDRLGVRCLLGLTATATLATAQDVGHHLGVLEEEEGGIAVRSAAVPSNLHLSVSMDREKDQALVSLLKGDRFNCLDSVIVYCTRREETTRIAALLRTCLQGVTLKESADDGGEEDSTTKRKKAEAKKKIRRPLKWISESYHAGMSAAQRRRVQNNFMSGQLRIVVATVAFGMGLDKSDVRGIIHYNMPKNFESYVQEIGRAGRDGKPAHCHLFLDSEGGDLNELRRHIYGDTVDYFAIKKLVQKVFPKCRCREIQQKSQALNMGEVDDDEMMDLLEQCEGPSPDQAVQSRADPGTHQRVCYKHERAIPIEPTVEALDVREEGIETLLCYLELHPRKWLDLLHPTLSSCRITCYGGPQQLRTLTKRCPPVAVCLARERLTGIDHKHCSSVEFNVVELADSMGWELLLVKRALRQLQWNTEFQKGFRGTGKSGILAEFSNLSFHLRSYGDLSDQDLDMICEFLHQKVVAREKSALYQLQACFKAFQSVAFRSCSRCAEEVNVERSAKLKAQLMEYFEKKLVTDENGIRVLSDKEDEDDDEDLGVAKLRDWETQIRADIRQFLTIRHEEKFSGRAIARIFHGIGSPCYPPQVYGRDRRYWRKYIHFDFNELIRLATEEIIRWK